jgi:molecular chaperone DnaK
MADGSAGIFGIDLGTTYSVVSYIDDSGKPVVVRDIMHNEDTVPSVVFFENESNYMVGKGAKESAILDPQHAISMVKRQMGNPDWSTSQFGKEYKAPAISALILDYLAKIAEGATGKKVDKVVITVPAYFPMVERAATKQAGQIAGLDVVAVVEEPVAAAFSYGIGSGDEDKTIFVYDLGGGTFDVTLIKLTKDSIDVVVVDGNHELGGRDWDEQLFNHLSEVVTRELGDEELLEDAYFLQDLWNKAEVMKMRLSEKESVTEIFRSSGAPAKVVVTRAGFEQMTRHLMEKTVEITQRCLDTGEAKEPGITGTITDVLLVGGSSLMPVVKTTLKEKFGWDPQLVDPHLAVAKGAALYAAGAVTRQIALKLAEDKREAAGGTVEDGEITPVLPPTEEELQEAVEIVAGQTVISAEKLGEIAKVKSSGVLPKAIGVKVIDASIPDVEAKYQADPDSVFVVWHLVDAQTALPYTPKEPFEAYTMGAGVDSLPIELWEQAGAVQGKALDQNSRLKVAEPEAAITGLGPFNLPKGSPIHLYFNVDSDGVVSLRAIEPTSGKRVEVTATVALLTDEEVAEAKAVFNGLTASL